MKAIKHAIPEIEMSVSQAPRTREQVTAMYSEEDGVYLICDSKVDNDKTFSLEVKVQFPVDVNPCFNDAVIKIMIDIGRKADGITHNARGSRKWVPM